MKRTIFAAPLLVALLWPVPISFAAEGQGVIVTVNDLPITSFDVEQRVKLNGVLGRNQGSAAEQRKRALQSLIDDVIKRSEARKFKAEPTEDMINKQIERMAKGSNTDVKGLTAQLKGKGVSMSALKHLVSAQISFNRMINALYKVKVEVDPAEVDKKYNELANDPRLQPVTAYEVLEIEMPVENAGDAMAQQLLVARAAEAMQFKKRYKGCGSAREAASGIFNVRIGKRMQADSRKLPKQLKVALDKAGPGGLIGPARNKGGIQLIAFCGKKSIAAEKPSREQIETMLLNKKYDVYEERYMREIRRKAFIEYKDAKASE